MDIITPPPVSQGDEVAVVAPSSQVSDDAVTIATNRLSELFDLSPVIYPSVDAASQLPPEERAEELHTAFESEQTAVFAVTGGADQMRLLRHLDPDRLCTNPTRFFGISDNTHIHLALSDVGLVSYYGCQFVPGLAWDPSFPEYTRQYLKRALFDDAIGEIHPSERWSDQHYDPTHPGSREWTENPGWTWEFSGTQTVTGRVWGGCFTVLEHFLAVNTFVPDPHALDGYVLALESSGLLPSPYYVKSVLRCLGERGFLHSASAIIVGRAKTRSDGPETEQPCEGYAKRQRAVIRAICGEYCDEMPIVFGLDFGHTDPQVPIPIGGQVRLNPERQSVRFLA
jgi:muramoyltetrapeptide carboxypeptidase LdcA involved in peptidoglycan recycling